MSLRIAPRLERIPPSATIAVSMKAEELRARGRDVIPLAAGEPDFDTPAHVRAAAQAAIEAGATRYTAVDGTPALKAAIAARYERDRALVFAPEEIIVSSGAKQSIFNTLLALLDHGDEVLVPAPYWVSYPGMVALAGGAPVIVPGRAEERFRLDPGRLEGAITPRTRLLILNAPGNPTGQCLREEELAAIAAVLERHPGVAVLCDDIYERVYWGEAPLRNLLEIAPQLRDRTILVNGVSKAYAMTGWRIGYAAAPAALVAAMRKIQGQSTSGPCSVSQAAARAALEGSQQCVRDMARSFHARHDFLVRALNAMDGVRCIPASGAFYAFPDCRLLIERCPWAADDVQLAEVLLERSGVATVPGSAFGQPGHLRLSYATSMEQLEVAAQRLAEFAGSF